MVPVLQGPRTVSLSTNGSSRSLPPPPLWRMMPHDAGSLLAWRACSSLRCSSRHPMRCLRTSAVSSESSEVVDTHAYPERPDTRAKGQVLQYLCAHHGSATDRYRHWESTYAKGSTPKGVPATQSQSQRVKLTLFSHTPPSLNRNAAPPRGRGSIYKYMARHVPRATSDDVRGSWPPAGGRKLKSDERSMVRCSWS